MLLVMSVVEVESQNMPLSRVCLRKRGLLACDDDQRIDDRM